MIIITTERIPIKLWLDNIDPEALQQAKNLANLPFAFNHIAVMPDAHVGYGMPIGGVLATKNMIVPNAVGVDIGCGMCATKTSLTDIDIPTLKKIMGETRKVVPLGFEHHSQKQDSALMPPLISKSPMIEKEFENALKQIGTLGGGNHFIEILKGSDNYIWIMLHSGSRNLGFKVANAYNQIAIKLNREWGNIVPKEWQLAYLPFDSDEGQSYFREMNFCVDFALSNRKLMLDRIMEIFTNVTHCSFEPFINIAHNYASLENHFGEDVIVHRKGATKATKNTIGIVPGSQGTSSYIVQGLGNPESFESCSHGAGRKMSREQAKKILSLKDEVKILEDKGIVHGMRTIKDLEEATSAYKDIEDVMKYQQDLVKILVKLSPLAVIRG